MLPRLQTLSAEEKIKLASVLKKKLRMRSVVFIGVILASVTAMLFFNKYSSLFRSEDNLGLVNVVFVVVIMLFARLLYAEVIDYGKEIASSNKKIIRTRIAGREGDKIVLGNKTFSKEEIILDNFDFDSLQAGDDVMLELSAKSNMIFAVKKASKE